MCRGGGSRAQGLVRGCGPHCPPVSRKNPARDEARDGAEQRRLLWAYKWFSGPLSCSLRGAARVQGGNPISIDQRPKPRKEG